MIHLLFLSAAQTDKFTMTLDDGSKLHLVAVSDSGFKQSWRPDGSSITIPESEYSDFESFGVLKGWQFLFVLVMPRDHGIHYSPYLDAGNGNHLAFSVDDHPNEWVIVRSFTPPNTPTADLTFGVAVDDWKPVVSARYANGRLTSGNFFGGRLKLFNEPIHEQVTDKDGSTHWVKPFTIAQSTVTYQIPAKYQTWDRDFRAFDVHGNYAHNGGWDVNEGGVTGTAYFHGKPSSIAKVQLLARPIHHITFRDVVIQPRNRRIS